MLNVFKTVGKIIVLTGFAVCDSVAAEEIKDKIRKYYMNCCIDDLGYRFLQAGVDVVSTGIACTIGYFGTRWVMNDHLKEPEEELE